MFSELDVEVPADCVFFGGDLWQPTGPKNAVMVKNTAKTKLLLRPIVRIATSLDKSIALDPHRNSNKR